MLTQLLQFVGITRRWTTFTREEVARHNTSESLWIIVGNSVLDITPLIGKHPGGNGALLKRGGGVKDCAEDLMFHGRAARRDAEKYKIGELSPNDVEKATSSPSTALPQIASPLQTSHATVTKLVVPTSPCERHTYGSDLEQWDDDIKDNLLSSSDTDIVVASNVNNARPPSVS
ncbi:hypothetical protein, conserved [Leishmania tarentolae]|uniref:Cytochrome b5 heme-binding domain-containing protein n=1 Tax=Leishmania tarentolae TaxID=5689 RepID=A0A640KS53_LEITA|nr:hypothetical protein, conserved [Leishmania tarentolae]GET90367.1 hypothetical protein, conserved [Leishmania tarentolae]